MIVVENHGWEGGPGEAGILALVDGPAWSWVHLPVDREPCRGSPGTLRPTSAVPPPHRGGGTKRKPGPQEVDNESCRLICRDPVINIFPYSYNFFTIDFRNMPG